MRTPTELRTIILNEASKLFMQQGYAATTIKQIARAADCTTAALYSYFEGGKPQILREVVRSCSADSAQIFANTTNATTLPVAREPVKRGEEVVYYTTAAFAGKVRQSGATFGQIDEAFGMPDIARKLRADPQRATTVTLSQLAGFMVHGVAEANKHAYEQGT